MWPLNRQFENSWSTLEANRMIKTPAPPRSEGLPRTILSFLPLIASLSHPPSAYKIFHFVHQLQGFYLLLNKIVFIDLFARYLPFTILLTINRWDAVIHEQVHKANYITRFTWLNFCFLTFFKATLHAQISCIKTNLCCLWNNSLIHTCFPFLILACLSEMPFSDVQTTNKLPHHSDVPKLYMNVLGSANTSV